MKKIIFLLFSMFFLVAFAVAEKVTDNLSPRVVLSIVEDVGEQVSSIEIEKGDLVLIQTVDHRPYYKNRMVRSAQRNQLCIIGSSGVTVLKSGKLNRYSNNFIEADSTFNMRQRLRDNCDSAYVQNIYLKSNYIRVLRQNL